MVELRSYQRDLLSQAEAALVAPKARVMLQLPTGGGKTRIASQLLAGWTRDGSKAAWLTHRLELSDQTCRVLNNTGVRARAVNTKEWDTDDPAPVIRGGVVILMAPAVSRRNRYEGVWEEYNSKDLLVIDETHHATADGWKRAIDQWPGRVVGLTATPWRLAKTQGFNHLFDRLLLGPQIKDMQSDGYLADSQVLMPAPDELILVGGPSSNGDYIEGEIETLNKDRSVWTGGALGYWQEHARGRQTIVYAVTTGHAKVLATTFNNADIPAAVILGKTPPEERARRIRQFADGQLKILINVAVATEGFDLPDASCIVLTRPTMSLALYLQMVGRGLRPKADGGNCLILDLAGNAERHGLPSDERQWSLEPRGSVSEGDDPPVVRCPDCEGVSPAASHDCQLCESPFGKRCQTCGAWRAWKRWSAETYCGDSHDLVCNRCHLDAHRYTTLRFDERLKEMLKPELTSRPDVDLYSLHTLEDVRDRLCEVAESLVYANNIGEMGIFNRMTEQLRKLLRREARLKKARDEEIEAELLAKHAPGLAARTKEYIEDMSELGINSRPTNISVEFHPEKGMRITLEEMVDDQPRTSVGEWEPLDSAATNVHDQISP